MLMKFWALQQAKREKRQYEFKSIKLSHKLPRIEKNINAIQKMYQKRQTQLESQAKMAQSNYEAQIRCQSGLSGASGSVFGGYTGGLASGFMAQAMNSLFASYLSQNKETDSSKCVSQDQFNAYMNGGAVTGLSTDQQNILYNIRNQASQSIQAWMTNEINNMQTWIENQKQMMINQMEEEQEAALLPLNEEQTQTELDKTFVEARLTALKEEIETLKSECAEEAKDMAPKFGLA